MDKAPVRIIQISDLHLFGNTSESLLGVNTDESLQAVLNLLTHENNIIDLILLTGDISQDGSENAYKRVAALLKPFKVPVYFAPGNHDYPTILARVYPCDTISAHKHIVLKNWHIILLNSQKPGSVEGYLDAGQLTYLEYCLQSYPEHQAIIVFHHQPVPVGSAWIDEIGLTNADVFWELAGRYSKINTVLFGHVHQEFEQVKNGIKCYSVPSTCFQFKRQENKFVLEKLPPGYRWIDLYEDGKMETGVERVPKYIGEFDENAKGY